MAKRGEPERAMTPKRRAAFLQALRDSGGVFSHACRVASPHSSRIDAAGVAPCYSSFRGLMARDLDFASAVAAVLDECREDVEREIHRRGQVGVLTPVFQGGARVLDHDGSPAVIRKFSDSLLLARMRALDPEKYGEKRTIEHRGTITHAAGVAWQINADDMQILDDAETDALIKILGKVRAHRAGETKALEYQPGEVVEAIDAEFREVEPEADELAVALGIEA